MPPFRLAMKTLRILGIRGLPAAHGGFETFAAHLAFFLRDRGWRVVVYCQLDETGPTREDQWEGIERILVPEPGTSALSTMRFDARSLWHAAQHPHDVCLTLGYNTASFNGLLKLKGIANLINMDGIEWTRAKWGPWAKAWLWLNDWIGCWVADHLIADNPGIETHLATRANPRKITMIPYGAVRVDAASDAPVRALGLEPGKYLTVIARPEPENSILDMVRAFSARTRGHQLVVLGQYDAHHPYHRAVRQAASAEVVFPGAIYDAATVQALRYHCLAYLHGHQVGGTNPSLVEAMGAGNAVIARDNRFNRWVAGPGARYFETPAQLEAQLDALLASPGELAAMQQASRQRFDAALTWPIVLQAYERLLSQFLPDGA